MSISIHFRPLKGGFSTVLGEFKGFRKKLKREMLRVLGRKGKEKEGIEQDGRNEEVIGMPFEGMSTRAPYDESTNEWIPNRRVLMEARITSVPDPDPTSSDVNLYKELVKFTSTMVELRLVREYEDYLSQEFHDLHEARTYRPSTSLNFAAMASTIRGEINWRSWQEFDTPTSLTTSTVPFPEEYLPHVETPWTNKTAKAARILGIPMTWLILEIEDYANHFTKSTTITLQRQHPSIEVLIKKGQWEKLAQRFARDMLVAGITFRKAEDRIKRVSLKEAIEGCRKEYFEALSTDEDGTVHWYPTPMTSRKMEMFAKGIWAAGEMDSDGTRGGRFG